MKRALLILMLGVSAWGQVIPLSRRIDWSAGVVGVPGGIPARSTIFTNAASAGANTNGAVDCSAIVQGLINACPSNQVIYFPAGRYLFTNTVAFGSRQGITWRGAGMTNTTIIDGVVDFSPTGLINVGVNNPSVQTHVLSGMTKGSTSLVVSNATGFAVGQLLSISQSNDTNFVWHPLGFDYVLEDIVKITSLSGTTIGVTPPLYWDFNIALVPKVQVYPTVNEFASFENMTITHTNSATGVLGLAGSSIFGDQTYGLWITNVESSFGKNRHFYFVDSVRGEVRHNYIHDAQNYGPNQGVGVELYANCSGFLVEDNILIRLFPSLMFSSGSGANAVAYNFSDGVLTGTELIGGDINSNHGSHTMMTLYEGNICVMFQSDSYFGSSSHTTVFRNFCKAIHPTLTQNRKALDLCRWSRYYNVVGNILGHPSITNWVYNQSTNSYPYTDSVIFRFGFPNTGNNLFNETPGQPDSRDLLTESTLILEGNYDYGTGLQHWSGAPIALPDSYLHDSKPSYFGSLTWPPFDPVARNTNYAAIPAGYRFINGSDPNSGSTARGYSRAKRARE